MADHALNSTVTYDHWTGRIQVCWLTAYAEEYCCAARRHCGTRFKAAIDPHSKVDIF